MAIIAGDQNNQQTGSNLNAGMNTGNQQQAPQPGSGAMTTTGQTASGQGGAGAQATSGNAQGKQATGNFTNFGSYLSSNQNAGNRLNNLLSGNVNQQASSAQDNLSSGAQNIQNAVNNENQRISSSLQSFQNAAQQTGQGNYSGFSQFLNPNQSIAPSAGSTQGGQAMPSPATTATTTSTTAANPNNANNPAYYALQTPYQQLATGQTQQAALQQQANNVYNQAGVAQSGLQNTAALAQTGSGVQQLLSGLLGQKGNYGQGAQSLDQSILTGDAGRYTNLLNNINQQNQAFGNNLTNQTQGLNTALTGLGTNATQAQQQAQAAATAGLGNLNTLLTGEATAANTAAAQQQKDIANQFANGQFSQDTAKQLGLQQGMTLFDVLKNNPSQYYTLNNNATQTTAANEINNQQLGAYSALQQMLGQSAGNFAYTQAGAGPAAAYNVNAGAFDKAMGTAYQNALNSANNTNINGQGSQSYSYGLANASHGTATANVNQMVNQLVNTQGLQAGEDYFNSLANQGNATPAPGTIGTNPITDTLTQGGHLAGTSGVSTAESSIPNMIKAGIASKGNPLAILAGGGMNLINGVNGALFGSSTQGSSQADANAQAQNNFMQNWQNYQNSLGYNNIAQVMGDVNTNRMPGAMPINNVS